MKKIIPLFSICLLAACAPAEQTYCDSYGVAPGHPEYEKCVSHYFQQDAAFRTDRQFCEIQADQTYPRSLYDTGHYERVHTGFGYGHGGYGGGFGSTVFVEPDYYHNRGVDDLRMRIIQPCMQSRGWVSGETWQAGRLKGAPVKAPVAAPVPAPVPTGKLPWLK